MGEDGKTISYRDQLKATKKYKLVHIGKTSLLIDNIWFSVLKAWKTTDSYVTDQCTFEMPCKNLTQDLVEDLNNFLQVNQLKAKLWFASGDFELPENPKQHFAQMLDLYGRISIAGRTPDFRHIAYNEERPLIHGTLSWNDYMQHGGTYTSVENIRVESGDNKIQVEDIFVNVNIHSAGAVSVIDSDLKKINAEDGGNIYAQHVNLIDSTVFSMGNESGNIESNSVYILGSQLSVQGSNTYNLKVSDGYIDIYESNLETRVDFCWNLMGADARAIVGYSPTILRLVSSRILMESTISCPKTFMGALLADTPEIFVIDSEISMKSTDGHLIAIGQLRYPNYPLILSNSKISVESLNDSAYAIHGADSTLKFIGEPSTIHVSSPVEAALYVYPESLMILNQSTTPSQCRINDENSVNC